MSFDDQESTSTSAEAPASNPSPSANQSGDVTAVSPPPEYFDCARRLAYSRERREGRRVIHRAVRALQGIGGLKAFQKVFGAKIQGDQSLTQKLLSEVVHAGHILATRFLLRAGAVPYICDFDAYNRGFVDTKHEKMAGRTLRVVGQAGARLEAPDYYLNRAISDGYVAIARELITLGADANKPCPEPGDVPPLICAICGPSLACVELLLRCGADPNFVAQAPFAVRERTEWCASIKVDRSVRYTPLDLADLICDAAAVRLLRKFGATLRLQTRYREVVGLGNGWRGMSLDPLLRVRSLIRNRASLSAIRQALLRVPDIGGVYNRLVDYACTAQRADVFRLLVEFGLPSLCSHSVLFSRRRSLPFAMVRMIYANSYSVKALDLRHIGFDNVQETRLILEQGTSVDLAWCEAFPDWVPDPRCGSGRFTPLMDAILFDAIPMAELLLSLGADPNRGRPVLPRPEMSKWLVDWGQAFCEALANEPMDVHGVPLHIAVITGNLRMVRLLLKHGADPRLAAALDDYLEQVHPASLRTRIKTLLCSRSGAASGKATSRSARRVRIQRTPS